MVKDVIGALMDSGMSPQEVRELVGPLAAELDDENNLSTHVHDPSGREHVLHAILTQARDERQPPGPHVVVPSGVVNSLPRAKEAKALRVDIEDSYRAFRSRRDLPEDSIEALSTAAQDELLGVAVGAFDPERGYASQNIVTIGSPDQTCVLCGVHGGSVMCTNCVSQLPALVAAYERGHASEILGFGERGAAASLYDDNPSATIEEMYRRPAELDDVLGEDAEEFYRREAELSTVLGKGDNFYRLPVQDAEGWNSGRSPFVGADPFYRLPVQDAEGYNSGRSPLVGMDDFYRLSRMSLEEGGLSALIGNVLALSVPSTVYAEEIPLSFHRPDQHQHIAAWRQGAHIYGSIRVTGWDGQPRILTGATPYAKEVGIVVGYATSARIPPAHTLAVLDPLARQLGASRLLPRLAASAPSVLRMAHGKLAPLVMTAMPVV